MSKVFIVCFLIFSNSVLSLPLKIKVAIDQIGVEAGDIIFIMNHSECASCINAELSFALNYSEKNSENVYFLNVDEQGKEKMEIKLASSGYLINYEKIVYNYDLYTYLKKKVLVQFTGEKFVQNILTWQKSNISSLQPVIFDSVQLPKRNGTISYDLIEQNGNQYFLSSDKGQIIFMNRNMTVVVDLYDKIDTTSLLNILNLNSVDSIITADYLKKRNLIGDRFVEFKSFCPSNNEEHLYLSLTVSGKHLYTLDEKKELMKNSTLALKTFSKDLDIDAIVNISKPVIIKLNKQWEVLDYISFEKSPEMYYLNIFSPFFINNDVIYANTFYYPEKYDDNFYQKNFLLEYLNLENNLITHTNFSEELKSKWYDHPKRYSNFTETSFQKIEDNVFLSTNSLTYWYNVTNKTVFEIPLKEIEKLAKKEKNKRYKKNFPSFSNLGILKYSPTEYFGFFRSPITAQIYYASFTEDGHFNKLEKLEIDTSYNGIIQVLNNRLVRTKEEQMIIYKLIKTSLHY